MADTYAKRWMARPVAARLVRVAIVVIPFLSAMVVAYALSSMLPIGASLEARLFRWAGIAVVATVVLMFVDRLARRLLPLTTLLKLTLVFPDQAPSRFKIAMKTGTTRQLRARIERARTVDPNETPAEAAERLLELVALLSHHDRLTRGHCERVRAYSHLIGEEMNLTRVELDKLRWAGLLHDVGKIAIPEEILNKPGRLTKDEFEVVKTHPDAGRALVAPLADWLGDSVRAVWEHHERFDGRGYPQGLSGVDISFAARVVAVADAYDVMTSTRSYKAPMSADNARAELASCSGTQFDPVVVRALLNVSIGRLKIMMGPLAFLAQWSIFGHAGVAHAGSTSGSTSSTLGAGATSTTSSTGGIVGSAVASSGAAAAGSASVATGAGTAATAVAVAAGVAAGAVGMATAPPAVSDDEQVAVYAEADDSVELMVLDDPANTLVDVDENYSAFERALAAELSAEGSLPPVTDAEVDQGQAPSTTRDPGNEDGKAAPATAAPTNDASTTAPTAPPATTAPPTTAPPATTGPPTTAPPTTAPPTTAPPTTAPPTTTPPTTTPPSGIDPQDLGTIYLAALTAGASESRPVLPLSIDPPPAIALPNYDTDRDDAPGLLVERGPAGLDETDSTRIQRFRVDVGVDGVLAGDARVQMYVAARDFATTSVHVQTGLYRCSDGGSCTPLASGDKVVPNADRFRLVTVPIGAVDEALQAGDQLELRIVVLDDSEADAWFAYGTAEFPSRLAISRD